MKQQTTTAKNASHGIRTGSSMVGLFHLLCGTLLTSLLTLSVLADPITNYFTDGFGTTSVDQYAGTSGGGWNTAWAPAVAAGISVTANVTTTAPLNGGGNYLNWRSGGTTKGAASISRQLNMSDTNVNTIYPYAVEFDYRYDARISAGVTNTTVAAAANPALGISAMTNKDDYVSFQMAGAAAADVTSKVSFWIKSQAAQTSTVPSLLPRTWSFFDGSVINSKETTGLWVNSTNMFMELNTVYHFKAVIYPADRLWAGSVTNVATGQGFDTTIAAGRKLRWNQAVDAASQIPTTSFLSLISRVGTTSAAGITNEQSLDNVVVAQLPVDQWPPVITNTGTSKFGPTPYDGGGYATTPFTGKTFYPASSNFVFTATSFGVNTLPASGVSLSLNGEIVSLTADGTDASQQRTFTYAGLKNNYNYTNVFISVTDSAGQTSTQISFFDTFDTNTAVIIEAENWNFAPDPTLFPPCNAAQTDGVRPDRYLQPWEYGGDSTNSILNTVNSYYMRQGQVGIDYQGAPGGPNGGNFRVNSCATGVQVLNSSSDDWDRVGEWTSLGLWPSSLPGAPFTENTVRSMGTNLWLNYTRVWDKTNYVAYLRASAGQTQGPQTPSAANWVYELDAVVESLTSSYTNNTQTSNVLAWFNVPNRLRPITMYDNPLVDASGYTKILPLDGKTTLKLNVVGGDTATAASSKSSIDYMVFIPVPDIKISNTSLSGSDLSFSINTILNAHYTIQTNSSVTGGTWGTFTTAVGTGGQVVIHNNPIDPSGILFYRAVSP